MALGEIVKAFISAMETGNSRIELSDEFGIVRHVFETTEIHVEVGKDNIEPLTRQHVQLMEPGAYAN